MGVAEISGHAGKPTGGLSLRRRREGAQPASVTASGQRPLPGPDSHHHADHRAATAGEL